MPKIEGDRVFTLCGCIEYSFWSAGTSLAAKFLRANGIRLLMVREEVIKLRGESDLFYFPPEHPSLTVEAQRAIDSAIDKKMKSGKFLSYILFSSSFGQLFNCQSFLLHVCEPRPFLCIFSMIVHYKALEYKPDLLKKVGKL